MAAWHTNTDLYYQWDEAESRAERWEKAAKEEQRRHELELSNIKARFSRRWRKCVGNWKANSEDNTGKCRFDEKA